MKRLEFVGIDYWSRPVYKDESGMFWKDVNLGSGTPHLHSSCPSDDFEGEPDMPITGEYEIVGSRWLDLSCRLLSADDWLLSADEKGTKINSRKEGAI